MFQAQFFLFFFLIYLAALGLCCGTWNLPSLLRHVGSFSCGTWTLSCGMWDLVSWPGTKPRPPALRVWSLSPWTTREVPGHSAKCLLPLSNNTGVFFHRSGSQRCKINFTGPKSRCRPDYTPLEAWGENQFTDRFQLLFQLWSVHSLTSWSFLPLQYEQWSILLYRHVAFFLVKSPYASLSLLWKM